MNEEYDDLQKEIIRQAKARALKILEFSDKTEKQLRDKLKEGEFPPFAVDEAVEYVRGYHYIDDLRYAEAYIRGRRSRKSTYELRMELRQKGVDADTIETALENEPSDELSALKELFIKKYGRKDLSDPKTYEKAFRYFATKGYGFDDIKRAISEAVEEQEAALEEQEESDS